MQFQMSFDEFKERLKPQKTKSEKEILNEVEDILNMSWG